MALRVVAGLTRVALRASIVALLVVSASGPRAQAQDSTRSSAASGRLLERQIGVLTLAAPPRAARALDQLAGSAETIVPEVSRLLGVEARVPFRMVLIPAGPAGDSEIAALDRRAPAWAAGFIDPAERRGAIRLQQAARYPYGTPEAVLAHETAHQLMHDVPGFDPPLWFEEGTATWVARGWQLEDIMMFSGRLLTANLPALNAMTPMFHGSSDQAEDAYSAAFAFVSWSSHRYGESFVRDLISEARTHSFNRAWWLATGEDLGRAEAVWRRDSLFRYRWLPVIMASSTLWLVILMIAAWVWVRKRLKARGARWSEDDDGSDLPWDAPPEPETPVAPETATAPEDRSPP